MQPRASAENFPGKGGGKGKKKQKIEKNSKKDRKITLLSLLQEGRGRSNGKKTKK